MRFIEGLRSDLKVVVLIQGPSNLDAASVLAQLQDEATDVHRRRDQMKPEYWSSGSTVHKTSFTSFATSQK